MRHIVEIETQVRDAAAVQSACTRRGLQAKNLAYRCLARHLVPWGARVGVFAAGDTVSAAIRVAEALHGMLSPTLGSRFLINLY